MDSLMSYNIFGTAVAGQTGLSPTTLAPGQMAVSGQTAFSARNIITVTGTFALVDGVGADVLLVLSSNTATDFVVADRKVICPSAAQNLLVGQCRFDLTNYNSQIIAAAPAHYVLIPGLDIVGNNVFRPVQSSVPGTGGPNWDTFQVLVLYPPSATQQIAPLSFILAD
jgi:hypothetical protein